MMLPTHAVFGLLVGTPILYVAPELAPVVFLSLLAGSIFPDMDMYRGHRRTFHYPSVFSLSAVLAVALALVVPVPTIIAGAGFLVGAAFHCQLDRLGGGLELQPWEAQSDRAVYDHLRGRWRQPKRLIKYDGSPGDLVVLTAISLPLLVLLDGTFRLVVGAALVIGVVYALLRKRLADLAPMVFGHLPEQFRSVVPDRYQS